MIIEKQFVRRSLASESEHFSLVERIVSTPVMMHLHNYYEIEIVLDGSGEQNLNGTLYPIEKGTFYFLTPIDFHSVSPTGDLKILNVSFDESFLSPELSLLFMNRRYDFIFHADSHIGQTADKLLSLIQNEIKLHDSFTQRCTQNLIDTLLCSLSREIKTGNPSYSSLPVQQAVRFLFQHFREHISLEQVAHQSGYTPSYFSKLFKKMTGKTFLDFLFDLRLNYAKMLLLSTNKTISEIAEKSGFGSVSHFHRRFLEKFSSSPMSYKKRIS